MYIPRSHSVNADGQHGVRGGGRRQHDPPVGARHHGHAHLSALALLQAHRRAGRGRAQGIINITALYKKIIIYD